MSTTALGSCENTNTEMVEETILPTYILKPLEGEKFYPSRVKAISSQALAETFANKKIDDASIEKWSKGSDDFETLANEIADSIKMKCVERLNMTRYKIIVAVYVGQKKDQGVIISSRCLWDTSTDNYVTVNFQNQNIWASVVVFGLYID